MRPAAGEGVADHAAVGGDAASGAQMEESGPRLGRMVRKMIMAERTGHADGLPDPGAVDDPGRKHRRISAAPVFLDGDLEDRGIRRVGAEREASGTLPHPLGRLEILQPPGQLRKLVGIDLDRLAWPIPKGPAAEVKPQRDGIGGFPPDLDDGRFEFDRPFAHRNMVRDPEPSREGQC